MYKSPIEKIYGELQTQMVQEDENMVMKAIREVGINVDKKELIKALQYDRNQYTKGYEDGKNEVLDKIRAEIIKYEDDCRLSVDEYPSCKQCTDNVFDTIYAILDKYKAESEGISVLEDIKAEIEEVRKNALGFPNWEYAKGLKTAWNIIDNHISRKEK